MQLDWNLVTNLLTLAASISLFCAGGTLLFRKEKGKESALALTAALFLVIILSGSKYKHFKGLGFEVDAWEQTEKQAQELIDRLTIRSEISAQQLSLLASRTGLMDSSLSNSELMDVFKQNEKVLDTIHTSKARQAEILQPIVDRIKKNYMFMSRNIALTTYMDALTNAQNEEYKTFQNQTKLGHTLAPDSVIQLQTFKEKLDEIHQQIFRLPFNSLLQNETTLPIIEIVKNSIDFPKHSKLLNVLNEIETDLQFYIKTGELKEDITYDDVMAKMGWPKN